MTTNHYAGFQSVARRVLNTGYHPDALPVYDALVRTAGKARAEGIAREVTTLLDQYGPEADPAAVNADLRRIADYLRAHGQGDAADLVPLDLMQSDITMWQYAGVIA